MSAATTRGTRTVLARTTPLAFTIAEDDLPGDAVAHYDGAGTLTFDPATDPEARRDTLARLAHEALMPLLELDDDGAQPWTAPAFVIIRGCPDPVWLDALRPLIGAQP